MPRAEDGAEQHAWDLLTKNFPWRFAEDFPVRIYGGVEALRARTQFQLFEVVVARIFAHLRPDYAWEVTANRTDEGLDFIGQQPFLDDAALGIDAAITVGGQCKKRKGKPRKRLAEEIGASLITMVDKKNPTFIVVAFSGRVPQDSVKEARAMLEGRFQRPCHILDRRQIEGLIHDHRGVVDEVIRKALDAKSTHEVLSYFDAAGHTRPSISVDVERDPQALAGESFFVRLVIRSSLVSAPTARLWWRGSGADPESEPVDLIGPFGATEPAGARLAANDPTEDPIQTQRALEMVTYTVGRVDLGEVLIGLGPEGLANPVDRIALGTVEVSENLRPRFYAAPFQTGLALLEQQYDRAMVRGLGSIGVVGAGGSGKSRLCEEFSRERRRLGSTVARASQANTLDDPHRVVAELFLQLTRDEVVPSDPVEAVLHAIARYDRALADRAAPAIRSTFGIGGGRAGTVSDQSVLSSLLLLIVARARRASLIIHLQDLHWCSADVLELLEHLVWRLGITFAAPNAPRRSPESGVLFIFEGRVRERQRLDDDGWASEPFEAFLQKLDCPVATCSSFTPAQGLEFIAKLFEDRSRSPRSRNQELLALQRQLIERIDRASGGNPFHSLEHVRLLKARRVIGQNPQTGLLYLVQPEPGETELPPSVFGAIELRWQYLKARTPDLALLVWAAALLEDRIPTPLFRRLWREIARDVSLVDVDATDVLWTARAEQPEVAFRHENYFRSIRQFEVSSSDRDRVVDVYVSWYEDTGAGDPTDRFRRARVLLERATPDVAGAQALLKSALRSARRRGDTRLARRIAATSLDLTWDEDVRSPIRITTFVRWCNEEIALVRDLLSTDRSQAARRLDRLRERIAQRPPGGGARPSRSALELERCRLTAEVLHSQILFNDRRPARAAEVAADAVRTIRVLRPRASGDDEPRWEELEMVALHAHAVGLALAGEIDESLEVCERALAIARRSASPLAYTIIQTYANILLARDPDAAEEILREFLADVPADAEHRGARDAAEIALGMVLVLHAHRLDRDDDRRASALDEAADRLRRVFDDAMLDRRDPHVAAAALMFGIVSALRGDGDEASWFAQAVAAAARCRQRETLWRAHSNYASAMFSAGAAVGEVVRDHARAALEIIEDSLSPYPQPDRTARFRLVRTPMAQAVRYLILANDPAGRAALERYPALRAHFEDPEAAVLRNPRDERMRYYEWLQVGDVYYVLF